MAKLLTIVVFFFCSDRFYIMAGMYGILILLMVLTQLFGGVYTAVVSR